MNFPEEDEELAAVLRQYSIPAMSGSSSQSLLNHSQYAKVIFHDLLPAYPTDADIWCRYTVTDGVRIRHGDRVALYCVGWDSVHDHVQFEMAPVPSEDQTKDERREDSEFQVLFKACNLPKDTSEFYQLCYVNVDSLVCGASVPFQFRRPSDDELCEVEEQEGLLVVRSRTAINEDKLRDATSLIDELEKQVSDHQRRIAHITEQRDKLESRLEELAHLERHEMRLQEDIQALDSEKSLLGLKVTSSEQRIEQLTATIEALNLDKVNLTSLLKDECNKQRADNTESQRLIAQLDNMQQMLDACTQSKEMAAQALHCEQSKVMRLNIEHDKYKFRCSCLEDENVALMTEVSRWQTNAVELKAQVEQNLAVLQAKTDSHTALSTLLEQRTTEHHDVARQLQAANNKVKEGGEHIANLVASLQRAENDVKAAKEEVDGLRVSVASLMTNMRPEREQLLQAQATITWLSEENAALMQSRADLDLANQVIANMRSEPEQLIRAHATIVSHEKNIKRLCEENAGLKQSRVELDLAREENAKLCAVIKELTSRHPSALRQAPSGDVIPLPDNAHMLLERAKPMAEGVHEEKPSPLAQLKNMLAAAEESHTSLKTELSLIDARQAVGFTESPRIAQLDRAKASVELQLAESNTRQQEARHRLNQIARRMAEIETESQTARDERDTLTSQHLAEVNDLQFLHQRMETLQEQVLREDEFQGMDRESEEVNRLERMSKRAHDLEQYVSRSSTSLHDATQIVLVLEAECDSLKSDSAALELTLETEAGVKCQLLEKLVDIDRQAMETREQEDEDKQKAAEACKLGMSTTAVYTMFPEGDFEGFSMMMDAVPAKSSSDQMGNCDHGDLAAEEASHVPIEKGFVEKLPGQCGSGEAELHLRLELAAAEYRKVYIDKLKAEKKLARMQKKCSNGSMSSDNSAADPSVENPAREFVCPICSATFPLTEPEPFTRHFEDHLS